jgi:shikimate dehydrogenase
LAQSVPSKITPLLFDVIYKPWPTVLAQRWLDQGGEVINGLELLIYQGIDQLDLVIDIGPSREDLASHLRKVVQAQ